MKKKLDFVTNSSSTSFCAWGLKFNFEDIPDQFIKNAYNYYVSKLSDGEEKITYDYFCDSIFDVDFFYDYIFTFIEEKNINHAVDFECEMLYIGDSPFSIPENMTVSEFKQKLIEKLNNLGLNGNEIEPITEIIYG